MGSEMCIRDSFAHCYVVLNLSLSAQKQHILVFRKTPNCSSVHSGMKGISLTELAHHNRCVLLMKGLLHVTILLAGEWKGPGRGSDLGERRSKEGERNVKGV